jgi:hypothetical protein
MRISPVTSTPAAATPINPVKPAATSAPDDQQKLADASSAVTLSSDANIVSTIGGSTTPSTYSAKGVLDSINIAGIAGAVTDDASKTADAAPVAPAKASTGLESGVYGASGNLQNLSAPTGNTY